MAEEAIEVVDETTPETTEEQTPQESPEETQDEQHEEIIETPEPETESEEPDDVLPAVPQYQGVDINQFIDPNTGIFDAQTYNAAIMQAQQGTIAAATAQMRQEMEYKNQWDKAIEAHPELKTNAKLRDMVAAYHLQNSNGERYMSPAKAAKEFFAIIGNKATEAKEAGIKQATESSTVQASAHLETSDTTRPVSAGKLEELKANIGNPDRVIARQSQEGFLKELIKAGKI